MTYTNLLSFIAGSHFAYVLSCCLLCSWSCFHSWNSFRPSLLWKKAMISGRKVLTIASSSCFGTPLFVSDEGGTSSIWISFLSVWIVAIRQRFYLCRSFLLLDLDRLCPSGGGFVIHFSSEICFCYLERVSENEIASCVKLEDTQDYESFVFNYLSIRYYNKFEHICQVFGVEPSLVSSFSHAELLFIAVRRFLCIAPKYLKSDLCHNRKNCFIEFFTCRPSGRFFLDYAQ